MSAKCDQTRQSLDQTREGPNRTAPDRTRKRLDQTRKGQDQTRDTQDRTSPARSCSMQNDITTHELIFFTVATMLLYTCQCATAIPDPSCTGTECVRVADKRLHIQTLHKTSHAVPCTTIYGSPQSVQQFIQDEDDLRSS